MWIIPYKKCKKEVIHKKLKKVVDNIKTFCDYKKAAERAAFLTEEIPITEP